MKKVLAGLFAGTAAVGIVTGINAKAQSFNVPPGTTQIVTNAISDGATITTVTMTGGGTLGLTNLGNTYSGGTVIVGGSTVQIDNDLELGFSLGGITLGDSSSFGSLRLISTLALSSGRNIFLNPGGGVIDAANTSLWTFSGVVSGTGLLTVTGPGSIALTGTNTNSGGVAVTGGATLNVGADTALGVATGGITLGDSTTAGTLTLTNNITATSARNVTIESGGGAINTNDVPAGTATDWTFTGLFSGAGPLTVGGAGTLILDGANPYSGTVTITGGTLELGDPTSTTASLAGGVVVNTGGILSGHGTILGLVTNSGGTVMTGTPGSVGPLTVGSFNQTAGTLTIQLSPSGPAELVVTGAATLGGTLHLVFNPGYYSATTYQLVSASSITGTFASITGNIGVGFSQDVSIGSTAVDLTLTKMAVLPEDPTIYPAITSVLVNEAQQINSIMVSRLSEARAQAMLDDLKISRYPEHIDGSAPGSSAYGAWARGQGGFGSTSSSGGVPGYDAKGGGIVTGVDLPINSGSAAAGIAVSYSYSSIDESGGATGKVSAPWLGIYGGTWQGPIAIDGAMGFGVPSLKATRPITSLGQSATSSFSGSEFTTGIQVSAPMRVGALVLTPAIGMNYAFVMQQDFTETGSTFDIDGHATHTNSLQPFFSAAAMMRFTTDSRLAFEPEVKAFYATELLNTTRRLVYQPPNDETDFTADGIAPSHSNFGISGGLMIETERALAFGADAGWVRAGGSSATVFDATIRYRF
ncbi:MAG TPA: autotransporter domain-containing protein [Stellaceae bacterium]|nr:autotransporter domain-containing protein [Stellaceae bacterium]